MLKDRPQYALIMMGELVKVYRKSVKAKELAEAAQVSHGSVEQVMRLLCKANLVRSVRGPGGGYKLARDPSQITIHDVGEAVSTASDISFPEISTALAGITIDRINWERRLDTENVNKVLDSMEPGAT